MKPKNLTELTDAELLDLVSNPDTSTIKVYDYPNDIIKFISVYNLKSGIEPIQTRLLHKLYIHWSKNPVQQKEFAYTLFDIFPSGKGTGQTVLFLDKKALDLHAEVIKLVTPVDKTRQKGWTEHFVKYLSFYNIKKGGLFIANSVLYNLYDKWCYKNKNRRPLGANQFDKFCKVFFENKLVKGCNWSKIDKSIEQHLTEDLINLMYKKKAKGNAKKDLKKK